MTLDDALAWADCHGTDFGSYSDQATVVLAAEVRRLQSPRSGVCQIGPPKQMAPTKHYTVTLDDRTVEAVREYGGGNLSAGIRRMAKALPAAPDQP